MKQFRKTLQRWAPWLLLLGSVDAFAALLLWLSDVRAFRSLIGTLLLFSLILFSAVLAFINLQEMKKQKRFLSFLSNPDPANEEMLLRTVSRQEQEPIRLLASLLRENQMQLQGLEDTLLDYEEYVEGWAHEAKTPLSLLTMIVDNHADELPAPLHIKLDYVRSQLQEDITQMLYYARLKSSTKDYRFENVPLDDLLEEVLADYAPLLEEKQFIIQNNLREERVFTDRRGLQFMLQQIISNSIKYSSDTPMLTISLEHTAQNHVLTVADNGIGVKSYDLPYIFQKGFTGDSTDSRKKATGMGLYLVKKMAEDLNLKVDATSQWGKCLSVSIAFPKIQDS